MILQAASAVQLAPSIPNMGRKLLAEFYLDFPVQLAQRMQKAENRGNFAVQMLQTN